MVVPPEQSTLITLDIDWVPDWMIASLANALCAAGVRATWFVTHQSPVLADLGSEPNFELGWHPNFLPNSTHGETPAAVFEHMRGIVPEAKSMRTHSLCQSEQHLLMALRDFGVRNDCSLHLPQTKPIEAHALRLKAGGPVLRRLPHFFQDNMHMFSGRSWQLEDPWFQRPGLAVYCFHPVHVVMNANSMAPYETLKTRARLSDLTPDDIGPVDLSEMGAGRLFHDLLEALKGRLSWQVDEWAECQLGSRDRRPESQLS